MRPIPDELLSGPFHRDQALALGVTVRMLDGSRFIPVFPRVYRHRDHEMSFSDQVSGARLALPAEAHPTGVTRLQMLGLDIGQRVPLHFVVEGELHLALPGVFLHRTVKLPPVDEVGVTPAAAFVALCVRATTIDAIVVGDWLLHREHMDGDELRALVTEQPWRDGAVEAAWVLDHLTGDARSLPESKSRAMVRFAGLPTPEPNAPITLGEAVVHGDLWFPAYRCVGEYEGEQHQLDRDQYVADIELYRRHGVGYVQLTKELLKQPRVLVRRVHEALVLRGYDGPPPDFGAGWDRLFARLSRGRSPSPAPAPGGGLTIVQAAGTVEGPPPGLARTRDAYRSGDMSTFRPRAKWWITHRSGRSTPFDSVPA